jgi:hypothetical protein
MKLKIYDENHKFTDFKFNQHINALLENFGWSKTFTVNRLEIFNR